MSRFINTELKSDSDSELDSEKIGAKFDAELMAKLESGTYSEQDILLICFVDFKQVLFMPIFLRK